MHRIVLRSDYSVEWPSNTTAVFILYCCWSAISYTFWPSWSSSGYVFFKGCKCYWPVCACGDWYNGLYINLFLMCHISCSELKKLGSGAKTQGFSIRVACAEFMFMELFMGFSW